MPVALREHTLANVPLLLALPDPPAPPAPIVLWFHGLGADSAVHRAELERVAGAGFIAVGVDAVAHGRRRAADLDARIAAPFAAARDSMLELAVASAAELPALLDALAAEGVGVAERVGAVGISMGGYLLYQAVTVEPRIRAAVSILGSPEWPYGGGPHRSIEALERTALLSITAELDASVPPAAARRLDAALAARGADAERHRYLELAGAHHLMSAEHWAATMDATVAWLVRHLGR